jgi:hypothetical protein
VWRAYERGLVLTVTRLAGGRWQATVEGPSVVERSPMPFRTRKRVMRRLKIGARVVIADGVHRELGPAT